MPPLDLPFYINFVFIATLLLTLALFLRATKYSKVVVLISFIWILVQGGLAYSGFYSDIAENPIKFGWGVPPTLLLILAVFVSKKGKLWINTMDIKTLTLLHTVRIPVELVLYWLFLYKAIPELMTFEGRNFDILAGITAPFVYYFGFIKNKIGKKGILIWNIISLLLLLNIVINAVLSAPLPFQQFAFEQPNIAIFHFPFIWLPTFIVPVVLFSHLATISRLANPANGLQ